MQKHGAVFWFVVSIMVHVVVADIDDYLHDVDVHLNGDLEDTTKAVVGLSIGIIIAIVVGCVLVLVLCVCCCYYCCCKSPPPAQHTVLVTQSAPPAQNTVVVTQAPQQPAHYPQPTMAAHQQARAPYPDQVPPYPGQQSSYGYVKL